MAEFDLVVVGAGPFGLIAAHTWLELHPDQRVAILEGDSDLGGAWFKSRVYPTMMTQTPLGMLEFSCFPMPTLPAKDTFYDYFSASHVVSYLEDFSEHKTFGGRTIKDRIHFKCFVKRINQVEDQWHIDAENEQSFKCAKLIIATVLTSLPNTPSFTTDNFRPPVLHSRDLASTTPLLSSAQIKEVVVVGGAKSAFDAVILLRNLGKSVTWIVRKDGQWPAVIAQPNAPWPLRNSHELTSMRIVAKTSPCIFEPFDSWAHFLNRTKIGIWLTDKTWCGVDWMWKHAAKYERNENMKMLKLDRRAFWTSDLLAVCNSPGLWDIVADATVLRDEIEKLDGEKAILKSGKHIRCDAVIACTGWLNSFPMFSDALAKKLGLPHPISNLKEEDDETKQWESRLEIADKKVTELFPRLLEQPKYPDRKPKSTPSRLYRTMVPIDGDDDRSIAFLGTIGTTQIFNVAEVQALWAAAYLSGELKLPVKEELIDDVALATAWRRRRYLGDGDTFLFEQLQYLSMLFRDLGLNENRKGGGLKELFSPYTSKDYKGLIEEWRNSQTKGM